MGRDPRFPVDVTGDEAAFGFDLAESPTGVYAVTVRLKNGLRAVKILADDGATEYAVCDERFQPLYVAARTLDELRHRFT